MDRRGLESQIRKRDGIKKRELQDEDEEEEKVLFLNLIYNTSNLLAEC